MSEGYEAAYWQRTEEVDLLRAQVAAYRQTYEALAHQVRAGLVVREEPPVEDSRRYFLVIGNGRTGSTWLVSSLGQLPQVAVGGEIKWRTPGRAPDASHLYIDAETASMKTLLREAIENIQKPIAGAKLIFNPYWFTGPEVFADIGRALEPDIRLIVLKRRYVETWLSWKVRGVYHKFDPAVAERMRIDPRGLPEPTPIRIVLTRDREPLGTQPEPAVYYALREAIDDMLVFFANDVQCLFLRPDRSIVDYSDIRLGELARLIGSQASEEDIGHAERQPLTLKLPPLDRMVAPLAPLEAISAVLDRGFYSAARTGRNPWAWGADGTAAVEVEGFREVLAEYGIETGERWRLGKPVHIL